MTVFEAHLCGTPAVVQDANGFDAQVVKGKNGYLIDYADAEEAKAFLEKVLRNPPSKKSVLQTTEQKSWDAQLPQLDDIVDTVAGFRVGSKCDWPTIVIFSLWLGFVFVVLSIATLVKALTLTKAKHEVRPRRRRSRRNKVDAVPIVT